MRPGDVVAHRFEIDRLLGSGGMASVYRGRDRQTGEPVAVKIILGFEREAPGDEARRFAREARFLSDLSHPAVVRHIGHGLTAEDEPYLVMEWLDGEDLPSASWVTRPSRGDTCSPCSPRCSSRRCRPSPRGGGVAQRRGHGGPARHPAGGDAYAEVLRAAGLVAESAEALSAAREHLHARASKIANPASRERCLRSHPGMPILGPRSRERSRVG